MMDKGLPNDGSVSYSDQAASFQVNATDATLPFTFTRAEVQSVLDIVKEGFATRVAALEAKVLTLESDHATAMNNMNNNNGGY